MTLKMVKTGKYVKTIKLAEFSRLWRLKLSNKSKPNIPNDFKIGKLTIVISCRK